MRWNTGNRQRSLFRLDHQDAFTQQSGDRRGVACQVLHTHRMPGHQQTYGRQVGSRQGHSAPIGQSEVGVSEFDIPESAQAHDMMGLQVGSSIGLRDG